MNKIEDYFSNKQWTIFWLLILTGVLLRWVGLDVRAFHHDESLNSIYGLYNHTEPHKFHPYNPLVHGPLLYHILPFFYNFFGKSEWTPRALMALMGTGVLFIPLLFRKFFNPKLLLGFIGFLCISPNMVYWSRFVRHDYLVIYSYILLLISIILLKPKWKAFGVFLAIAIHWCAKENIFVFFALAIGYILYDFFYYQFFSQEKNPIIHGIINNLKRYARYWLFGFGISAILFSYLYSQKFRHAQGILDGLYLKSFLYWFKQHKVQRINGPFSFQFFTLSFYEQFFMVLHIPWFLHLVKQLSQKFKLTMLLGLSSIFLIYCLSKLTNDLSQFFIFDFLKLKLHLDVFLSFSLIFISVLITTFHLKHGDRLLSIFSYFYFASFFTYSYLGEKVPWLSLYILIPGSLYFLNYLQKYWFPIYKSKVFIFTIFIGVLWTIPICLITNFSRAGMNTELISQVHTHHRYKDLTKRLLDEINSPLIFPPKRVYISGISNWPSFWHYYQNPRANFNAKIPLEELVKYDYAIVDTSDRPKNQVLIKTHHKKFIPFRGWWIPNYQKMTLRNFLFYALSHNPWNHPGNASVYLYIKK